MLRLLLVCIFTILIASCAAQQEAQLTTQPHPQSSTQKPEFTQCPEQRANMCTRQYLPVCATRDSGVRCVTTPCPSREQKTYGNGCEACADKKVLGYIANACTPEPAKK